MKKSLLLLFLLTACDPPVNTASSESGAVEKVKAGRVALVAIAPDGTKLWAVRPNDGRTVYFSSAGAYSSHTESCGKNCTQEVADDVPAQ